MKQLLYKFLGALADQYGDASVRKIILSQPAYERLQMEFAQYSTCLPTKPVGLHTMSFTVAGQTVEITSEQPPQRGTPLVSLAEMLHAEPPPSLVKRKFREFL